MYEKGACNTRIAAAVLNLICEYQKGENPWHDIILFLLKTLNFRIFWRHKLKKKLIYSRRPRNHTLSIKIICSPQQVATVLIIFAIKGKLCLLVLSWLYSNSAIGGQEQGMVWGLLAGPLIPIWTVLQFLVPVLGEVCKKAPSTKPCSQGKNHKK